MTAKQEIKTWRKEFSTLSTDAEKKAFKERIHAELGSRDETSLIEGLKALKEYAGEIRVETEKMVKPPARFQVFPGSDEDIEILRALLVRMGIPFEVSA